MGIPWIGNRHVILLILMATALMSATSVSAQQQQQQALLPLHIELGPLNMLRMPSWVALGEGIYKKNGLNVDQCHTPGTRSDLISLGIEPPPDMYICSTNTAAIAGSKIDTTTPGFLM